jgi:hypothetical protein
LVEILKQSWTRYAALSTTILAVGAAISAARGGTMSTRTMITTTKEANAWAYFQAKSIKQHASELHVDELEFAAATAMTDGAMKLAAERLAAAREDVARYDREKTEIQAQAESLGAAGDFYKRHGGRVSLAVMLLQIAIMLNSVGAVLAKRWMWILGMAAGVVGLAYMVGGFLL